jgi:NADPH2:quinone reductase
VKAIHVTQYGSPEVLQVVEVPEPKPSPRQALIDIKVTGYNFHDAATRQGIFPDPPIPVPFIPGVEAAGIVEAIGDEVTEVKVGDRVAFNVEGADTYAEKSVVNSDRLVPIPDDISFEVAASLTAQGGTTHYLMNEFRTIEPGVTLLIQAGASGMGLLLTQWAKHLGAKVMTTVSNEAKAQAVREAGADEVILYTQTDFVQEVKRLTEGKGVDIVIDGVGTTLAGSLEAVKTRGLVITYGKAGGEPELMNPFNLLYRSRTLAGSDYFDFVAERDDLLRRTLAAFDGYREGWLKPTIARVLPLEEARYAHELMRDRNLIGKILLTQEGA